MTSAAINREELYSRFASSSAKVDIELRVHTMLEPLSIDDRRDVLFHLLAMGELPAFVESARKLARSTAASVAAATPTAHASAAKPAKKKPGPKPKAQTANGHANGKANGAAHAPQGTMTARIVEVLKASPGRSAMEIARTAFRNKPNALAPVSSALSAMKKKGRAINDTTGKWSLVEPVADA